MNERLSAQFRSYVSGIICLAVSHAGWSAERVEQLAFFESRVRPVLVEHCYECHSAKGEKLQAGLRVDHRAALLEGGDSGPAVVPENPDASLLMEAVRYESFEMPPSGKLSESQIDALEQWIADGAIWPDEPIPLATSPEEEPTTDWQARRDSHWSWHPLQVHSIPQVKERSWPANPIDNFVLSDLEQADLAPAPAADAFALLRRLYFDLIGLPPPPEVVQQFAAAPSDVAYRQLVDQLLASPQFGEKWSRHWLDLVRFAETCGHEFDFPLPHAYEYRDYVIRAWNSDVAYDQLLVEHLAGDLLPSPRRHPIDQFNESIIGTGFWFMGEAVHAPTDVRGDEADRINNQIDVMGRAFLALTIGCARCHDHKFDPIPTTDYYALTGFLQSSRRQEALLDAHGAIDKLAREVDQLRDKATLAWRETPAHTTSDIEAYLQATAEVLSTDQPIEAVAVASDLDPVHLQSWVEALRDQRCDEVDHPLYSWKRLACGPVADAKLDSAADFRQRQQTLSVQLRDLRQRLQEVRRQMVLFKDFSDGDFTDWFVTGWAFGDRPTTAGLLDLTYEYPRLLPIGVAHSGGRGKRFQGVLRSPTFVLEHRQIHYRLAAHDTKIRLVIDGYNMADVHSLLFADATLKSVDTGGRVRWITQTQDLYHYLGHRAHLEIVDHGDGHAAVHEIWMSDGPPPPDPPHEIALRLAGDDHIQSVAQATRALAEEFERANEMLHRGELDSTGTDLLNWQLEHRLLAPPEPVTQSFDSARRLLADSRATPTLVMAMTDGTPEDDHVHIRGHHTRLGPVVPRRFLTALAKDTQATSDRGSGRLDLARQIAAADNPLTARVMVNRLWHHLLGRGLVPSVDDFGAMGEAPTHPELLDWLAADFIAHDWSLKHAIRQIVTSRTYRMASQNPAANAQEQDPANRLWHRTFVRRLTAEAIRDTLLAVSGELDPQMYGPSIPVHLTEAMQGRGRPNSGPLDGLGRRSLYTKVQRNFLSPMMLTFDMPSPFNTMGRRSVSNVPAQSLILMNDPFVWQQTEAWARRLVDQHDASTASRIDHAFLSALGRPPTDAQREALTAFITSQLNGDESAQNQLLAWTDACHAIVNMKSFLLLE